VSLAARNLSTATLGRATEISALDLVKADKVVFSLTGIEALLNKLQHPDSKS